MAKIKNSHQVIQMNQNQGPISFQFSLKTVMTFCSIWAFFGYKWTKVFPALVSFFILSDNFFWFLTYFWINWISRSIWCAESFEKKKKSFKKSNIQAACQTLKIIGVAISIHIISFQFLNTSRKFRKAKISWFEAKKYP